MSLEGKVVLITGSSRGIGRSIAIACAKQGATVVVHCGKSVEELHGVIQEIQELGAESSGIHVDLQQDFAVNFLFNRVMDTYGRLDILVNNAAVSSGFTPLMDVTPSAWSRCMEVNLSAPYFLAQKCIPEIVMNNGSIINISSLSAGRPRTVSIDYSIAKKGLNILTKSFAKLFPEIRINALAIGYTDTKLLNPQRRAKIAAEENPPYIAHPDEIAEGVLWLLSDSASHVTGKIVSYMGRHDLEALQQKFKKK